MRSAHTFNDTLTLSDRKKIDGYYNSQHPVIKTPQKTVECDVEPETPIKPINVLDMPMCSIGELAVFLRLSRQTLKRYGKQGKLNAVRINTRGDRRYMRDEIIRYMESDKCIK